MVVMAAATSSITERSPYIVRTSFTLPQVTVGVADWANKNKLKKFVTLVSDYGPGIDAEKTFKERVQLNGGQVVAELRVPLATRISRPSCSACATPSPRRCSSSCRRASGSAFMKQFAERGLDKAGIRLIATGDLTDDDILNDMGDVALGVVIVAPLLGGAPVGDEQEVRRGLRQGQRRHAAELLRRQRLRRHARHHGGR